MGLYWLSSPLSGQKFSPFEVLQRIVVSGTNFLSVVKHVPWFPIFTRRALIDYQVFFYRINDIIDSQDYISDWSQSNNYRFINQGRGNDAESCPFPRRDRRNVDRCPNNVDAKKNGIIYGKPCPFINSLFLDEHQPTWTIVALAAEPRKPEFRSQPSW